MLAIFGEDVKQKNATFMAQPKKTVSRFDLSNAVSLGHCGNPPASNNVETVTVAVPDPHKGPGQRVLAKTNRRVDILEWERSHDRISDDAYREGRVAQAIFERAGFRGGGSTWRQGSRVDAEIAKELAIIGLISDARIVDDYMDFLRDTLGKQSPDAAIVRQVLGENRRYADVVLPRHRLKALPNGEELLAQQEAGRLAKRKAKPREKYVTYIAQRFRDALESMADAAGQKRKGR